MCSEGAKAGGTREARSSQPALIHPGMSRVRRTGRGRESCWGSTGAKGTTRRWTQVTGVLLFVSLPSYAFFPMAV